MYLEASDVEYDAIAFEESEVKISSKISSLIFNTFYPTQDLPKVEIREKKKGRPKKNLPKIEGKQIHMMEDDWYDKSHISSSTKHKIILDFKEYLEEGKTRKEALLLTSSLYEVSYIQVYGICERI